MNKTILRADFIGKKVKIGSILGRIINETKNIVTIKDTKGDEKKFIKKNHKFIITIKNSKYEINGEDIVARPEERIKKKFR